jgi:hypothetical protein
MGRVSDSLYFLRKWNGILSPIKMLKFCTLTWKQREDLKMDTFRVPLLSLLTTAVKSSRRELEDVLGLLCYTGDGFDLRNIYRDPKSLKLRFSEINQLLTKYFKTGDLDLSALKWPSLSQRLLSMRELFEKIRERLIKKILALQVKFHGDSDRTFEQFTCLSEPNVLQDFYKVFGQFIKVKEFYSGNPEGYIAFRDFLEQFF